MKIILLSLVALIGAATLLTGFWGCSRGGSGPFSARSSHWPPEKKLDHMKSWIASRLDLSETQKAELDRIAADLAGTHDKLADARHDMKARLLDELRKEQVDPQTLKNIFEAKRPLVDEMIDTAAEKIAAFHSILTPEQREKMIADLQAHGDRCRFGHHW